MDPYRILDVSRDSTSEEIEDAYRKKAKETHPDLGGSSQEFKKVKDAYEIITEESDSSSVSSSSAPVFVYPAKVNYVNYQDIVAEYDSKPTLENMKKYFKNTDCKSFTVEKDQYILEGAESAGNSWPYSCRGGACSNCVVRLINGSVSTPSYHILTEELLKKGYRLTCIGKPMSEEIDLVYNIRDRPELKELLLPDRG